MISPPLLKQADLDGSGGTATPTLPIVRGSVPEISTGSNNIATFRLAISRVEKDTDGALAAIATINFTVGNVGLPNYTTSVLPDGQELLRMLVEYGKAKEVMTIVNKMNIDGGLWAIIPLCEALVENGGAKGVWEKISGMDFEKEGRGFFGDRYSKLLLMIQEKYTHPDLSTALRKLGK